MEHETDLRELKKQWRHGTIIRTAVKLWHSGKLIAFYLVAVIAANLLLAHFGPWFAPINALVFIAFNLTSKDSLQRRWGLGWKMTALILAGSVLSVLFSLSAWRIAVASFAAFLLAGLGDAIVFERLKRRGWLWQVNGSNVVGAILDSVLFLVIAFGWPPIWPALVLQIVAKIFGGFVWSLIGVGCATGINRARYPGRPA